MGGFLDGLDGLDEIITDFVAESRESLDELDQALVALEREPGSRELLSAVFRTIHTIKGTSGFLEFTALESSTHVGETVLARVRDGQMALDAQATSALLALVDLVRALLDDIEQSGAESDRDPGPVIAALQACLDAGGSAPDPDAEIATETEAADAEAANEPPAATADASSTDAAPAGLAGPGPAPAAAPEADGAWRPVVDATVRVDVGLLDRLMRAVGELVLTRNQMLQYVDAIEHAGLQRSAQRLDAIATELQDGVMRTRMQPIEQVFAKLPRMVRDLSAQVGKPVALVVEGQDTELDRSLLDAVRDPLVHLVRNAVDHGLESPERRAAAGKPAEGTLLVRAYHASGQVVVEVADDGGGIDVARVRAKAVSSGAAGADEVARMSDAQALDLVFRPGFSTAEQVTNVSGRGVGMDVVRTNLERIGGSVELVSALGVGTTARLRIPLTLAVIPALTVVADGQRYAIPQAHLLELVRLEDEDHDWGLEWVGGKAVHRLRGRLLPLVFLADVLGVPRAAAGDVLTIAVLSADGASFGLVVDAVLDTQEIVVRPLGRLLAQLAVFAGATITGDGAVALILDVPGVGRRAWATPPEPLAAASSDGPVVPAPADGAGEAMVVVCASGGRTLAVPMDEVVRLEELDVDRVERSAGMDVVQYRGEIMRLLPLGRMVGGGADVRPEERVPVVVHRAPTGALLGMVVARTLDVVAERLAVTDLGAGDGLAGTAIVAGQVVDVVDVAGLAARALSGPVPPVWAEG